MQQPAGPDADHAPSKNEFHVDLEFERYQAADGINATGLKEILRSPAHYQVYKTQPAKAETEAMRFGKLVHMAVLEPARFRFLSVVQPSFNLRTNAGRDDLAKWRADQDSKAIVMTEADQPRIQGMLAAVEAHPMLCRLLADGKREVSVWWDDPDTKVLCKGRLDFVSAKGVAVDLKTTKDARAEPFARDVVQNMYHVQMAHYLKAGEATGLFAFDQYAWVAIEKEAPFAIAIYVASSVMRGIGEQWRAHATEIYAQAFHADMWPGLPSMATELEPPPWAAVPPLEQRA